MRSVGPSRHVGRLPCRSPFSCRPCLHASDEAFHHVGTAIAGKEFFPRCEEARGRPAHDGDRRRLQGRGRRAPRVLGRRKHLLHPREDRAERRPCCGWVGGRAQVGGQAAEHLSGLRCQRYVIGSRWGFGEGLPVAGHEPFQVRSRALGGLGEKVGRGLAAFFVIVVGRRTYAEGPREGGLPARPENGLAKTGQTLR